jgi:signal recognition particle GTPase
MPKNGTAHAERSPLATAASALEAELKRYAELASEAMHAPLTSEKNIDRAGRALLAAAECEKGLTDLVRTLVDAVSTARQTQEATSASLAERGALIVERRAELEGLLARFATLGETAKLLNDGLQKLGGYKGNPYDGNDASELREALVQIDVGMTTVAEHAAELAKDAAARELADLGRQADGLRQQILSAKNRLAHLHKGLPS